MKVAKSRSGSFANQHSEKSGEDNTTVYSQVKHPRGGSLKSAAEQPSKP
jgi:hypothetical protein